MPSFRTSLALAAAVVLLAEARAAEVSAEKKTESVRLTAESLARFSAAEASENDWKAIYDEGIRLGEAAALSDPTSAEAHWAVFVNIGRRAKRSGVTAQITIIGRLRELIEKTVELDPRHARGWEARGEMLIALPWLLGGSTEGGKKSLEEAARLAPNWAKPPLRLAKLHENEGETAQALAHAEKALALAEASGDAEYRKEARALLVRLNED